MAMKKFGYEFNWTFCCMPKYFIGPIFILFVLTACIDNPFKRKKHINPDYVFFDYKIRGEENQENVTVYIQYRNVGPNGRGLVLEDPAEVRLDGELIHPDSTKLTGAYYEIQKPLESFAGPHTIVLTDQNKKQYKEEFQYHPFMLVTSLGSAIHRESLVLNFEGLSPVDYIDLTATDTSFTSRDINEIDTVKNGRLELSKDKLKNLVNGPITLLISKETEGGVQNGTKAGGTILISYGLQREFELTD